MIAGAVGEADAVDVALDDARDDRAPSQIDHLRAGLRGGVFAAPTDAKRPLRMVTVLATVLRASIVWMRPLTSVRSCGGPPAAAARLLDLRRGEHGLRPAGGGRRPYPPLPLYRGISAATCRWEFFA